MSLVIVAFLVGRAAYAQTGRITGQVSDTVGGRPLAGVAVTVVGEGDRALAAVRTDAAGRYTLGAVAAGSVQVRARMFGYGPKDRAITVTAGQTVTADFLLSQRSIQLDQVVVTGTGGSVERRAVGNVIETINASDVLKTSAPRSVEQLIGARTPGVVVLPATGQVGTGAQIRVRSVGSLSLSTDPIVYIDGVRMDASAARGPGQRGGAGASRLNDINPEDIETIEIIKGPAAATLYGTEASNGVVQIITKRGSNSTPHWDFTTRQGTNWLANPEGRAGTLWSKNATSGQLETLNLYRYAIDSGQGPVFQTGKNRGYTANLHGGNDITRYYLSSSYDDDLGVVAWNYDKKFAGRANIDIAANSKLRIEGSLGYIRDRIRLAQNGSINPDPFSNLVWGRRSLIPTTGGFGFTPASLWDDVEDRADVDRTTTSVTARYEPRAWFTNRLAVGLDVNSENNSTLYPRETPENAGFYGSNGLGAKTVERASRNFLTLDYSGNLKYAVRSLDFTTTGGFQAYRSELSNISASGTTFPAAPITTVSGTTVKNATEGYVANATVGLFIQQALAWQNRLFLTAAVRGDDNSAFGKDYSAAYYPKVSASWVVSEEPIWKDKAGFIGRALGDLRFRGAYGAAGAQPGTFDAARLYTSSVGYQNVGGLVPSSFGNPQLKPERSTELELGFETSLLDRRMDVSYTHFARSVNDAIVNVPVPPSVGFPGTQVTNIGHLSTWGNEFSATLRILRGHRVAWDVGTQLANTGNRVDDLGGQDFLTVGGGGQAQARVGYGIADFFMYKVRSAVLSPTGAVLSAICDGGTGKSGLEQGGPDAPCPIGTYTGTAAPRVYWGHTQPTWQQGFNTQITLWDNLRLYARVDGNGGNWQSDTEIRALHNQGSTKAVIEQNDQFLQTYRAIEADAPSTYQAGFLKLRELSASYTLKPSLVQRLGASGGAVTIAGRNLSMLWTAEQGWNTSRDGEIYVDIANQHVWDPETRAVGPLSNGFQTIMPPTSSFVATFRLTY
ncbi:MAG: TonB-dependent outer membrane protein SusC/RagA [Gemmatimonadetes bacterium]|nr:TonB-dependent outer membrane protein SusC/RagA [Gemmatimonadota bacterium]